ncbi:pyridoxal phosphate-dependent aminotransferase family protein [Frankia sp. Cppng1_Ct_nod]|uniref:aminotransferase class I/II-fold pyridoxal phosphate-dependent enzyme n=1 Tax=Frankia sp. Cppng1_Ct_nod TaxID=2897162 RepID=UPI001F5F8282|nr:pyridoxal phosphate-dependent aminotransferase family protein [Frankia sp. Cppng1_Ct_nod]
MPSTPQQLPTFKPPLASTGPFDRLLSRPLGPLAELARLRYTHPMVDSIVDEIDGRRIRIGDHWLSDFASCNYLGFDLNPEIIAAVPEYLARWGTHPSWSRLIASPRLFTEIEDELTDLLGAEDSLVIPTITHIHLSIIPALAGKGAIFVDRQAHRTIQEGCLMARAQGATVQRFDDSNPAQLEELLRACPTHPRLVCIDGVNSMTGNTPPLAELASVCRTNDAILYVDDAHGFGVIGERDVCEPNPYGMRGNSLVRHIGENYDGIILVGGFSKAYSSLLAFVACPTEVKNYLKITASPYTFSGPSPVASLATVQAGLRLNAKQGDAIRTGLHHKTARILDEMVRIGLRTLNRSGLPIIEVPIGRPEDVDALGKHLFKRGIYVTLAPYPVVPRGNVGFRVQVTAANTDEEITHLISVLDEVAGMFPPAAEHE